MATRPSWSGYLKVSLVVCPIELHSATTHAQNVTFHFIHPKTQHRVQMRPYDPDLGLVDRKDLVRGYEVAKGRYVTVDDEDLEKVRLESTKTIDVESFVAAGEIDPIYFDRPYYVLPDGPTAVESYAIIRDAMRKEGKVALGRFVLTNREHAVAIAPHGKGLLATTLHDPHEVVSEKGLFDKIKSEKRDPALIEIATKIIDQKTAKFDPGKFEDRYESALRQMIQRRAKGAKATAEAPKEPEATNVVDLMAALKASLKGADRAGTARSGSEKAAADIVPFRKSGGTRKSAARKPRPERKRRRKTAAR
jgi:DNA end-binding protein Ku